MMNSLTSTRAITAPIGLAALLATTCLAARPALAADAPAAGSTALAEIVVTAEKRSENIQKVPMSIQAIDTKKLDQLNVTNFQDYVKFIPSIQFQTFAPSSTIIYMRGVADGGNGNHSGPLPSVGTYLDELPITTILGTLDVHIYDIARVEVLPGPQGTLYGASSEAGTMRIITNKPDTSGLYGAIDLEGNTVDHGSEGFVTEGFINVPVTDHIAFRLVAFDEHDSGYINNVYGQRAFVQCGAEVAYYCNGTPGPVTSVINNADSVKKHFNPVDTFGGRLAAKFDLGDNWTIEPQVISQDMRASGIFGYNPAVGDLEVNRFQPDSEHDRWIQAGLTINGKIGKYDLTYAGGYFNRKINSLEDYTDYSVAYDQYYGSGVNWQDANGNPLAHPQQEIVGNDRFEKGSNEIRLASPATDRFRFIVGLFQERQTHWIIQDYQIQGFSPTLAVPGWANTIWLTDQDRVDSDKAAFGEVSFDVTPKFTITGGLRYYGYNNSLYGFYGFSQAYDDMTGFGPGNSNVGITPTNPYGYGCIPGLSFRNAPCVDLDKAPSKGSGETHKINATYRITGDKLVYFTYSTGYRPGGVNRSGAFAPYQQDTLSNFEVGWKTSWFDRSLTWNGALYDEEWNKFQFAFLGPNSLTIVENAPSARILGVETNVDWRATEHLTLSAAGAINDAELSANFCGTDQTTGNLITNCPNSAALAQKGQQLAYTPKFNGNATARYTFPLFSWDGHAQAAVVYQSKRSPAVFTADIQNLGEMPGYATLDLSFGAQRGKTSFEIFAKNVTDERGQINRYTPCTTSVCAPSYPAGVGSNGIAYPGTPPAVYVVPIQPLTIGIRLGQKF